MSAKATFWAWRQKTKSSSKLVLLCLANNHNEDTDRCDPGPAYISEMTGLDVKTIRSAVKKLSDEGLITAHQRTGRSPNYVFNWGAGDLFNQFNRPNSALPENGHTQKEPCPNSDNTAPKNGCGPYPETTIPENGYTQNQPYPEPVSTLPENGFDPTQKRVPNLKEPKENLKDIYLDFSLSEIPSDFDKKTVMAYIDHRRTKNPGFNQEALQGILDIALTAKDYAQVKLTPNQIIKHATDQGWVSLKIKWFFENHPITTQPAQKQTPQSMPEWQQRGFQSSEHFAEYCQVVGIINFYRGIPEDKLTEYQKSEIANARNRLAQVMQNGAAA